jgi:hypothetical protein
MSAAVVIRGTDKVHLISDGAVYSPDNGVVLSFANKAFGIPHLRCAISFRSASANAMALVHPMSAATSYNVLRREIAELLTNGEKAIGAPIECYVCGFDDAGQSNAYAVVAGDIAPIESFAAAPCDPPAHTELAEFLGGIEIEDFDPVRGGQRIIETIRRHPTRQPNGSMAHTVGGFASLITVGRDHIEQRVICRWPWDLIGQPISPNLDESNAAVRAMMKRCA